MGLWIGYVWCVNVSVVCVCDCVFVCGKPTPKLKIGFIKNKFYLGKVIHELLSCSAKQLNDLLFYSIFVFMPPYVFSTLPGGEVERHTDNNNKQETITID